MSQPDKLFYFKARARGEATRMLYVLADVPFIDDTVSFEDWPSKKAETPLGQIPILTTVQGELIQSNTIARYVARKLGLVGSGGWNEALNDQIVETMHEFSNTLIDKFTKWKHLKLIPEPENVDQVVAHLRTELLKRLDLVKSVKDKVGKKFLLCDNIQLADVWLYTSLQFAQQAIPDAMEITPWVKEFVSNFEANPRLKKYLADRPDSIL